MNYAVIMAGGTGKRLWPLSRQKRPKQVLKLLDGQTLLGRCFERLIPVFDVRNILALTNAGYADLVRENLPDLPSNNVIAEPVVRDTTGAIGLAATVLAKYDPNAVMALLTADQLIEPPEVLQQALADAFTFISGNGFWLIRWDQARFPVPLSGISSARSAPLSQVPQYGLFRGGFQREARRGDGPAVCRERRVFLEFGHVRLACEDDSGQPAKVPA
jgi:hypothetical protein